jgi:hypothetical protein
MYRWFPWEDSVKMWMTNITLQANVEENHACRTSGMDVRAGQLYAEGTSAALTYPDIVQTYFTSLPRLLMAAKLDFVTG